MADQEDAGHEGYRDWRALEMAIKDAAKKAARQAGPGVSAASVAAQIRQARFDRFLSRVFADGEHSEWLLKGGMSMLARVPRSRTTGRGPRRTSDRDHRQTTAQRHRSV